MLDRSGLRVLVVDDHPLFRIGLRRVLEGQGFGSVDEAVDGAHAVELTQGRGYDVVLLDIKMPRLNGLEAARAISARSGPCPLLIALSTFDEPAVLLEARNCGISRVLSKDIEPSALAGIIDAFLDGSLDAQTALDRRDLISLTRRELDVLRLVATGASSKEIAARLGISAETVKDHLSGVFGKLNVNDRVSAVRAARKQGWLVLDELRGTRGRDRS